MRYSLLLFILLTTFNLSLAQEAEVTTYYFIRHAEKDLSNPSEKNPHLTEIGFERAGNWSIIFSGLSFDAIYSTDYYRTKETAEPIAKKNNLVISIYDPKSKDYVETFLKDSKGKTVLIVGHSNSTPTFVNAILKENKYKNLDEKIYGNLYIVTIIDGKSSDILLTIN